MLRILLTALLAGLPLGGVAAQTVEYTIPETVELVPGRLAVTFAEEVSEPVARALVERAGYRVVEAHFHPVRLTAQTETLLTPAQEAALRDHPAVIGLDVLDRFAPIPPAEHPAEALRYEVILVLAPGITAAEARQHASRVPALRFGAPHRLPNDLIIAVEAGGEEQAIDALGAVPLVRYVTYLMKDDG
ncbi:MAG: hypothetical protein R3247_00155 [Rhodothermales bacterium]|nr:hypothetical protein [Rhodothermales bacterium]